MFLALAISISNSKTVLYYSVESQGDCNTDGLYVKCTGDVLDEFGLYVKCGGARETCTHVFHQDLYGRSDGKWFTFRHGKWITHPASPSDETMKISQAKPLDVLKTKNNIIEKASKKFDTRLERLRTKLGQADHSGRRLTGAEILALRKPSRPRVVLERLLEEIKRANGM